jgi:hypothetical protein
MLTPVTNDPACTQPPRLNFGLAATAMVHVVMLAPLAMGAGGPLAPGLLAIWALTSGFGGGPLLAKPLALPCHATAYA